MCFTPCAEVSALTKRLLRVQLVLDSQKRVFSWGFGGYGRLGHAEQKDEMVPRLIKLFDFPGRGASQIYTGYQCSFALSENGESTSHAGITRGTYNFNQATCTVTSCDESIGFFQGGCFFGG